MPFPASDLEKTIFLKVILLGPSGVGKTTAALDMPPPIRVILCETDSALDYPLACWKAEGKSQAEINKILSCDRATSWKTMMEAVAAARADAEAGKIKTVVVDPLNFFADRLIDEAMIWTKTKEGNEDGRRAHPECTKRLRQLTYQLLGLPCHMIVISHYMDVGDAPKRGGPDKVPLLPNKEARAIVHGMFPHKLWMEMQEGRRVFVTTPQGFAGPGVRGYRGAETIDASFALLMEALSIPTANKTTKVAFAARPNGAATAARQNGAPARPAPAATRPAPAQVRR